MSIARGADVRKLVRIPLVFAAAIFRLNGRPDAWAAVSVRDDVRRWIDLRRKSLADKYIVADVDTVPAIRASAIVHPLPPIP